MKLLMN